MSVITTLYNWILFLIPLKKSIGFGFGFCILLFTSSVLSDESTITTKELSVAVLGVDINQRYIYDWLVREFEFQHPGIKLTLVAKTDAQYKKSISEWFEQNSGPDVLAWQGGERLFQYVREGKIQSIEDLWTSNNWDQVFLNSTSNTVLYDGQHFGVPMSYYNWGIYYRRSIFREQGLLEPLNWHDFIQICEKLKSAGYVPITIGTKDQWTASAWFTYITLRLHGKNFYERLIKGEISFKDKKVILIFEHWNKLIERDYFPNEHERLLWNQTMPPLYRGIAAMSLSAGFVASQFPEALQDDIGYFDFPYITPGVPRIEQAPTDIFLIPKYSKKKALAEIFLAFVASQDIQSEYNKQFWTIPPNQSATIRGDYYSRKALTSLTSAADIVQFFDRDTPDKVHNALLPIFAEFMVQGDISKVSSTIEQLREDSLFER